MEHSKTKAVRKLTAFLFSLLAFSGQVDYVQCTMICARPAVQEWRLIDSGTCTAAENMAVDEELLGQAARGNIRPTLRLYAWDPPAVSVGRFQAIETAVRADVCDRHGFGIVRRVTGGRAVLHNQELTYSIVSGAGNPLFPPNVLGTYKVIARGLLAGLRTLGIRAEMLSRSSRHAALIGTKAKSPSCFSAPSRYEILAGGKKLIGSAQRRIPGAFLQHGSILIKYDPSLEAAVIPGGNGGGEITSVSEALGREVALDEAKQAFIRGFAEALEIVFVPRS